MKIANVQMQMHYLVEDNLRSILQYISLAAGKGARLIAFPELAVTGCHKEIRRASDDIRSSLDWIDQIAAECRRHSVFAFIGAPTFADDAILDSYLLVDDSGKVRGASHKIGLTSSEQTYFTCGDVRKIWTVGNVKIGIVICREIADLPELLQDIGGEVDLLLWPCFSNVQESVPEEIEQFSYEQAQRVAEQLGACLIQSNWANSLNRPELQEIGGSVYISTSGKKLATAPLGEPGFGIVDTATETFEWYGSDVA